MTEQTTLTLPSLSGVNRYPAVPRRYEETKPVLIQDFSHRRILGLGHSIHQRLIKQAEDEKTASIEATEKAVRSEAQSHHEQALQRLHDDAKKEQEQIIKRLQKEQEQAIKKEALRVEMAMQKSALELVRQERDDADKKLTEALAEVEARYSQIKEEAVNAVREEERYNAGQQIAKLTRTHQDEIRLKEENAKRGLEETITNLTMEKEKAVEEAIKKTEKQEQHKYAEELAAAIVSYDLELAKLRIEMDIQLNEINRLLLKVEERDKSKERLNEELQKTRRSFQDYITRVGKFTDGHAGFMIKPLSESILELTETQ